MIAAGLCMMGGCFAQNEEGAAVETYWHAQNVDLTSEQVALIHRNAFPGGSSETDVCHASLYVDLLDPPAAIITDTIPFVYANVKLDDGSFIMSGVYMITYAGSAEIRYGNPVKYIPNFSGWLKITAQNNTCRWTLNDAELITMTASFKVPDGHSRIYYLRTGQIRQFEYMSYSNATTGVKWQVLAMRSASGLGALWDNYALTLTEI